MSFRLLTKKKKKHKGKMKKEKKLMAYLKELVVDIYYNGEI